MDYLISVIVTVYNRENFIQKCIDSVLSQTELPIELLLIDDGSTDKSYEICKTYADKYDNVKLFHQENGGISKARNVGLDNASGRYIAFLDDDDIMTPGSFKVLADAMAKYDVDFAAGNFERVNEDGSFHSESHMPDNVKNRVISTDEYWNAIFDKKAHFIFVVNWAKLFKREIWDDLRFPAEFRKAEDEYVQADILAKCTRIYVSDYIVHKQIMSQQSITRSPFTLNTLRAPETKLVTTDKLIKSGQYKYAVKKWGIACGEILFSTKSIFDTATSKEVQRLYDWSCQLGKVLFKHMDIKKKIKFICYQVYYPLLKMRSNKNISSGEA